MPRPVFHAYCLAAALAGACVAPPLRAAEAPLSPGVFRIRGMPYDAFDRLPARRLTVGDATLDVAVAPGIELGLAPELVLGWVYASARAVADYYGRFPVARARVLIVPTEGARVRGGAAYGHFGAAVRVAIGRNTPAAGVRRDWVMAHEIVHLGFPAIAERHHWIEEGLATYVEPVARAQAGLLMPEEVWADLMQGLPKGLPRASDSSDSSDASDKGLDYTRDWNRTYWGGALYWLLADIEIRSRSGNRFGLARALRGIVDAGGTIEVDNWPIEKVLAIGDAATGTPVLSEIYHRMNAAPARTDLDDLWRRLGVTLDGGAVRFDDTAPLADIRRAITRGSERMAAHD